MSVYFISSVVLLIIAGFGYQTLIAPRRWMARYGDGNYSDLRQTYKNAGIGNSKGL